MKIYPHFNLAMASINGSLQLFPSWGGGGGCLKSLKKIQLGITQSNTLQATRKKERIYLAIVDPSEEFSQHENQ